MERKSSKAGAISTASMLVKIASRTRCVPSYWTDTISCEERSESMLSANLRYASKTASRWDKSKKT